MEAKWHNGFEIKPGCKAIKKPAAGEGGGQAFGRRLGVDARC
jgi:hypothetical protein